MPGLGLEVGFVANLLLNSNQLNCTSPPQRYRPGPVPSAAAHPPLRRPAPLLSAPHARGHRMTLAGGHQQGTWCWRSGGQEVEGG